MLDTEELKQLNQYLDGMYNETDDVAFLAVKLNFLLGLRVGELVALKCTILLVVLAPKHSFRFGQLLQILLSQKYCRYPSRVVVFQYRCCFSGQM